MQSKHVFHFWVTANDGSENTVQGGIGNRISGRDTASKEKKRSSCDSRRGSPDPSWRDQKMENACRFPIAMQGYAFTFKMCQKISRSCAGEGRTPKQKNKEKLSKKMSVCGRRRGDSVGARTNSKKKEESVVLVLRNKVAESETCSKHPLPPKGEQMVSLPEQLSPFPPKSANSERERERKK